MLTKVQHFVDYTFHPVFGVVFGDKIRKAFSS